MNEIVCRAADGFPLAAQVSGPDDGQPLLLLQGQSNSHRWWNTVRASFEDRFRTVTFDYRGAGRSRGPVEAWSTSGFAEDARCVLDHLGISRAAVYGTSMGGRIAQILAAHHSERVTSLVLACTTPGGPHAMPQPEEVQRELRSAPPAQRIGILHDLFFTPAHAPRPEDRLLLGDPTMGAGEVAAHRRASARHDAWDLLPSIPVPTLVLHGDGDRMNLPENADLLAKRIPDARLEIVPGGRHGFFSEFAAQVNPLVTAHLMSDAR